VCKRRLIPWIALLVNLFATYPTYCAAQLDQYGGTMGVHCPKGPKSHFYTQKVGDRWWLCDPAGSGFFIKGVFYAVPNANSNSLQPKYTSCTNSACSDTTNNWEANWALEQVRRLQSWGFNAFAEGAIDEALPSATDPAWSPYSTDNTIPIKMPFGYETLMTRYAFFNSHKYGKQPLKDMMNGVGSVFSGWRYRFGDYYDPAFPGFANNLLKNDVDGLQLYMSRHSDYFIYAIVDESDDTGMLDAGPDFQEGDVSNTGQLQGVSTVPELGWLTLVTAPTQSSNSAFGQTYRDHELYSKLAEANYLLNEYVCKGGSTSAACCTGNGTGICSADPASAHYVGSTNLTSATKALDAAWAAKYSTLSTTDPHCTGNLQSCLQSGTYASFGTGHGMLDEDGTCPSRGWAVACWLGSNPSTLAGETGEMQADMSGFYSAYLDKYFSILTAAFHTYAPGILLGSFGGSYGTPPFREVLIEASKYVDLIQGGPPTWICSACTDQQQRVDFMARYWNGPWMEWQGFYAQADSPQSRHVTAGAAYATQAQRGAGYQAMVNSLVNAKDSNGTYHVVGFEWWDLYDQDSYGENWGLLTATDNPYDGVSATINGINGTHGVDRWGYPTGGERANYGDFVSRVTAANVGVYTSLLRAEPNRPR
jgi:hypothetical protein